MKTDTRSQLLALLTAVVLCLAVPALAHAGATITGHVTTGGGVTPVQSATVNLFRFNSNLFVTPDNTTTAADGTYSFTNLPPGLYTVRAVKNSFAVRYYGGAGDQGAADYFALTGSETRSGVDIDLLTTFGTITGQVTNAVGGAVIASATVQARGPHPRTAFVRSTSTNASGNYTLTGLPPGKYIIEVRASGHAQRYYVAAPGRGWATPIEVTAGGTASSINVALETTYNSISGLVSDLAGQPVTSVCVGAELVVGGFVRSVCPNADGTYQIDGLPLGVYKVNATSEGAYQPQYYNGQLVYATADDVTVAVGAVTDNINFSLDENPGWISGRITRSDTSQPIVGASLSTRTSNNDSIWGEASRSDGNYVLRGLPPGYYKVRVSHPDFALRYYAPTGGAETFSDGAFIAVSANAGTPNIDIALSPVFGRITGRVTEADGTTPIAGASVAVRVEANRSSVASDTSDASGNYEITGLPPGNYVVRASIRGRAIQHYNGHTTDAAADVVAVAAGDATANINFALSTANGSLSGRITQNDGTTPIEGAGISVYDAASGGLVTGDTTNSNGNFQVTALPPGTYKVRANALGYANRYFLTGQPGTPSIDLASGVAVTNGADTPGANIRLTQSSFVSGTVSYYGAQTGALVIQLFLDSGFTGTATNTRTIEAPVSFPAAYTFGDPVGPDTRGVIPGTYYERAFVDVNGNGIPDASEPLGIRGGGTPTPVLVSGEGVTVSDVNLTVMDPGERPKATLLAPSGAGIEATPIYTWQPVPGATWYELWVNDSGQARKIDTWYTSAGVGCAGGIGTCVVSPSTPLAPGTATWWIQWWGDEIGYGSWSDGMGFTVSQPSTMATLVSPSGATTDTTPTYTWQAVPGMTWYYLWIEHSSVARIQLWMTKETAGCGSGTGLCSYTPATVLGLGTGIWWVEVWSPAGYGPWSDGKSFTVTP
jgi:uncharacterized protein (DUF2141 family)